MENSEEVRQEPTKEAPEELPRIEEKPKLEAPKLGWWQRRMIEHLQPFCLVAHLVAAGFICWGLWSHNFVWIIAGVVICFLGHLSLWIKK